MTTKRKETVDQALTHFENVSLREAVGRLMEQKQRIIDYVVPLASLRMDHLGAVRCSGHGQVDSLTLTPNMLCNSQIAEKLNIPVRYWRRMLEENPSLMAKNFNSWALHETTKGNKARKVLVRGLTDEAGGTEGTMRALLSNSYFIYDNLELLALVVEETSRLNEQHDLGLKVKNCSLTDRKMYVRFYNPELTANAPTALKNYRDPNNGATGGIGQSNGLTTGFAVTNSDTGHASASIAPSVFFQACNNWMVWKEEEFKKVHLGARLDEGKVIWRKETILANQATVKNQVRDMIHKIAHPDYLGKRMQEIEDMAARRLENPGNAVKNVCKAFNFSESEMEGIFNHFLAQGSSTSAFDISQAMTSFAQVGTTPEKRFQMEAAATRVMAVIDKCDTHKVISS